MSVPILQPVLSKGRRTWVGRGRQVLRWPPRERQRPVWPGLVCTCRRTRTLRPTCPTPQVWRGGGCLGKDPPRARLDPGRRRVCLGYWRERLGVPVLAHSTYRHPCCLVTLNLTILSLWLLCYENNGHVTQWSFPPTLGFGSQRMVRGCAPPVLPGQGGSRASMVTAMLGPPGDCAPVPVLVQEPRPRCPARPAAPPGSLLPSRGTSPFLCPLLFQGTRRVQSRPSFAVT